LVSVEAMGVTKVSVNLWGWQWVQRSVLLNELEPAKMSGTLKVLAGAREYLMAGVNLWARHLAVK
jgi:CRISPR/Cas system-associated endoribonuclease Cas2